MGYATKADVQGLGEEFSIPSGFSDADVTLAISRAGQRIDSVTRNHFTAESGSFIVSGDGTAILALPTLIPIVTVTKVQYRDSYAKADDFDANGDTEDEDDYDVSESRISLIRIEPAYPRSGRRGADPYWIDGYKNYKVTGTFGCSSVPENIRLATVYLVREEMLPGWCLKYEQPTQETFPDGYAHYFMRERRAQSQASSTMRPLTGIRAVDILIGPYQNNVPLLVVP